VNPPHRSSLLCPSCSEPLLCGPSHWAHSVVLLCCIGPKCRSQEAERGAYGHTEAEAFEFLKANIETEGMK